MFTRSGMSVSLSLASVSIKLSGLLPLFRCGRDQKTRSDMIYEVISSHPNDIGGLWEVSINLFQCEILFPVDVLCSH